MNEDLKQREQLSALMDGQLQADEWLQALQAAQQEEGRCTWHAYHVVGDVLRSAELAQGTPSRVFLARFQQRLAQEPAPVLATPLQEAFVPLVAPTAGEGLPQAANASLFRWKMLAGFASLAVVASVGWNSWSKLQPDGPAGTQLAIATPAPAPAPAVAQGAASSSAAPMLRDPRLDELLAAHKQFGGTTALQMPAGFLRNATFEAPTR